MREETLRWGLMLGLIAAIFCTVAVALGALIAPLRFVTSAEAVAFAYFTRGMLSFIALGVALGLSYYAGLRSERDLKRAQAAQAPQTEQPIESEQQEPASVPWGERWNAPITGAMVMLFFWIASTASSYLFPLSQPGVPQPHNQALANAELHLILLVVYLLFGLGAGGIGGRAYAARLVLDRIIVAPPSLPSHATPQDDANNTEPASPAPVSDESTLPTATPVSGDMQ